MSRAATATPPPQAYFPQRNTTPTMRHCSAPSVTAAHFANRNGYQHQPGKRRTKNLPQSTNASNSSPLKKTGSGASPDGGDALGLSFEDLGAPSSEYDTEPPSYLRQNSMASYTSSSSTDSFRSSEPEQCSDSSSFRQTGIDTGRSTPISDSVSSSLSQAPTQLMTPSSSQIPLPVQTLSNQQDVCAQPIAQQDPPAARASWVEKMTMAVVNTGMSIGLPFGQVDKRLKPLLTQCLGTSSSALDAVTPVPSANPTLTKPTVEDLQRLSLEEQLAVKREWAEAENRKVTECARLCSQWPHSGYNMSKYGPNGSAGSYQPQSFANPHHVAGVMQRQAELERYIALNAGMFFSCQRGSNRDMSDDDTDPSSVGSYESSQASPTTSLSMSTDEALAAAMSQQKTAAEIKAAMASPLVNMENLPDVVDTRDPSGPEKALNCIKVAKDIPELSLGKDESAMDVDQTDTSDTGSLANSTDLSDSLPISRNRPARAQSCGAKRPLTIEVNEEDKRRRVDEAMVVEEAIETGVIMPPTRSSPVNRMSASVPDLSKARAQAQTPSAVFGHVVKTSDTHPIIISPFFPADLLPILFQHLVMPPPAGPFSQKPLLLGSTIDVPSLLLSYVPPAPGVGVVPSPVLSSSMPNHHQFQSGKGKTVGNLLLSSCPGKRLRMDGPSRGRGPVCRDLATDLRRIKSEGVGCLVCCLDDAELALLGVPWETYREVAADTGLDVIRLPMPDGFTPVSLGLFDSQVTLIATKYSLQGVNVLIHCRGGVGRAGLTACAWAIKMGYVAPHPSLSLIEAASQRQNPGACPPAELEHQIVMSIVERVIAMIRSRRGLKAIESFEQVQFLARYVGWLREEVRA